MADALKGKNLVLFIKNGVTATMVGQVKSFDVNSQRELTDYTDITTGDFKNYVASTIETDISISGYVTLLTTDGALTLEDKYKAGSKVSIVVGAPTIDPATTKATGWDESKTYWGGDVLFSSFKMSNGGNGELITFSCDGKGTGAFIRTDKA